MTLTQFSAWLNGAYFDTDLTLGYEFIVFKNIPAGMQVEISKYANRDDEYASIFITHRVSRRPAPGERKLILVELALRGLL